jgi:hypothetical protein
MALVAGVGVITWLLIAADQIRREPGSSTLCHLRRYSDNGEPFAYGHASTPWISWSKYWRKVLGLPWPGTFVCPCKEEFERGKGRKTVDLATSNDMNEMHDLLFPMLEEYDRELKRRKTGHPNSVPTQQ